MNSLKTDYHGMVDLSTQTQILLKNYLGYLLMTVSQTYSREAIAKGFCRGTRSDSTLTEMSVDLKARSRWASVDGKFVVV